MTLQIAKRNRNNRVRTPSRRRAVHPEVALRSALTRRKSAVHWEDHITGRRRHTRDLP